MTKQTTNGKLQTGASNNPEKIKKTIPEIINSFGITQEKTLREVKCVPFVESKRTVTLTIIVFAKSNLGAVDEAVAQLAINRKDYSFKTNILELSKHQN